MTVEAPYIYGMSPSLPTRRRVKIARLEIPGRAVDDFGGARWETSEGAADDVCERSPVMIPQRRRSAGLRRMTLRELIESRRTLDTGAWSPNSERGRRDGARQCVVSDAGNTSDLDSAFQSPVDAARAALSQSQSTASVAPLAGCLSETPSRVSSVADLFNRGAEGERVAKSTAKSTTTMKTCGTKSMQTSRMRRETLSRQLSRRFGLV